MSTYRAAWDLLLAEAEVPRHAAVSANSRQRTEPSSGAVRLGAVLVAFFSGIFTLGTGMQRVVMASGYGGVLIAGGILLASGAIALVVSAPSPDPPAPGGRRKPAPPPAHPHPPSPGHDGSHVQRRDSKRSARTARLRVGCHPTSISKSAPRGRTTSAGVTR